MAVLSLLCSVALGHLEAEVGAVRRLQGAGSTPARSSWSPTGDLATGTESGKKATAVIVYLFEEGISKLWELFQNSPL